MFDVIVIGGSLAGTACVIELTRKGLKVALVEKNTLPERKPCGEGLSSLGLNNLQALGIICPVLPLRGHRIWKDGRAVIVGDTDQRCTGSTFGIRRISLEIALRSVIERIAEPIWGVKIKSLEFTRSEVRVCAKNQVLTARALVLADGVHSLTAARLGVSCRRDKRQIYGASAVCSSKTNLGRVNVLVNRDYETYLTPVTDGLVNLSFLGTGAAIRSLFGAGRIEEEIKRLQDRFDINLVEGLRGMGAISPVARPSVFGKAFLTGDTVQSLDPVCGMGMTHALGSGRNAGIALASALNAECSWEEAARRYSTMQHALSTPLKGYSKAVELMVRRVRPLAFLHLVEKLRLSSYFTNGLKTHGLSTSILHLIGSLQ